MDNFLQSLWQLTLSMAPYLMLGFFIAGLLYAFVPRQYYGRLVSRPGFRSVVNATLLGIPLPLCSCGVLPTTVSLRRNGASRGACTSFLIATPQTGVDSILATYSLLGLPFAIIRPLAALVTGVAGGVATDRILGDDREGVSTTANNAATAAKVSFTGKMRIALAYAFGELLEDVGRWLVVGLVVAALITAAVPDNFFSVLQQWPLVNMLLVLLLAIPMYICATGSIPIALSLIIKGMTPGAAFVMLMAGPAINAASMLVIDKTLGRKQMAIYITTIIIGALAFGLAIDYLLPSQWFMPPAAAMTATGHCENCTEHETSLFSIVCGAAFTILLARALWHRHTGHSACTCHDDRCSCHDGDCSCHGKEEGEKEERCQCHNGAYTDSARQKQMSFSVEGMRCSHCAANVREALTALPEIDSADVDLPSGHLTVTIKERCTISADTITDAISKAGYKASAL